MTIRAMIDGVERDLTPEEEAAYLAELNAPPPVAELIAYANAAQSRKAFGGYTTSIGGQQYTFDTSPGGVALMASKVLVLQQPEPPVSVWWQVGAVEFVEIQAADFIALCKAIDDYIQPTFDYLRMTVLPGIAAGTVTTFAEIDAAFAAL
jgi:hypothetical protein